MNRDRQKGIVHERMAKAIDRTVAEHCERHTETAAIVAQECGIADSTLSNYRKGTAGCPIDICVKLMTVTGLRYIGIELARVMNDVYLVRPDGTVDCAVAAECVNSFGALLSNLGVAQADKIITTQEAANVKAAGVQVIEKIHGLLLNVEEQSKPTNVRVIKGVM